eukprot:m.114672 g.114672  ORF g.114672 m.114672 type:complete len:1736 (+) comp12826_c0_seq1:107-5314(+)
MSAKRPHVAAESPSKKGKNNSVAPPTASSKSTTVRVKVLSLDAIRKEKEKENDHQEAGDDEREGERDSKQNEGDTSNQDGDLPQTEEQEPQRETFHKDDDLGDLVSFEPSADEIDDDDDVAVGHESEENVHAVYSPSEDMTSNNDQLPPTTKEVTKSTSTPSVSTPNTTNTNQRNKTENTKKAGKKNKVKTSDSGGEASLKKRPTPFENLLKNIANKSVPGNYIGKCVEDLVLSKDAIKLKQVMEMCRRYGIFLPLRDIASIIRNKEMQSLYFKDAPNENVEANTKTNRKEDQQASKEGDQSGDGKEKQKKDNSIPLASSKSKSIENDSDRNTNRLEPTQNKKEQMEEQEQEKGGKEGKEERGGEEQQPSQQQSQQQQKDDHQHKKEVEMNGNPLHWQLVWDCLDFLVEGNFYHPRDVNIAVNLICSSAQPRMALHFYIFLKNKRVSFGTKQKAMLLERMSLMKDIGSRDIQCLVKIAIGEEDVPVRLLDLCISHLVNDVAIKYSDLKKLIEKRLKSCSDDNHLFWKNEFNEFVTTLDDKPLLELIETLFQDFPLVLEQLSDEHLCKFPVSVEEIKTNPPFVDLVFDELLRRGSKFITKEMYDVRVRKLTTADTRTNPYTSFYCKLQAHTDWLEPSLLQSVFVEAVKNKDLKVAAEVHNRVWKKEDIDGIPEFNRNQLNNAEKELINRLIAASMWKDTAVGLLRHRIAEVGGFDIEFSSHVILLVTKSKIKEFWRAASMLLKDNEPLQDKYLRLIFLNTDLAMDDNRLRKLLYQPKGKKPLVKLSYSILVIYLKQCWEQSGSNKGMAKCMWTAYEYMKENFEEDFRECAKKARDHFHEITRICHAFPMCTVPSCAYSHVVKMDVWTYMFKIAKSNEVHLSNLYYDCIDFGFPQPPKLCERVFQAVLCCKGETMLKSLAKATHAFCNQSPPQLWKGGELLSPALLIEIACNLKGYDMDIAAKLLNKWLPAKVPASFVDRRYGIGELIKLLIEKEAYEPVKSLLLTTLPMNTLTDTLELLAKKECSKLTRFCYRNCRALKKRIPKHLHRDLFRIFVDSGYLKAAKDIFFLAKEEEVELDFSFVKRLLEGTFKEKEPKLMRFGARTFMEYLRNGRYGPVVDPISEDTYNAVGLSPGELQILLHEVMYYGRVVKRDKLFTIYLPQTAFEVPLAAKKKAKHEESKREQTQEKPGDGGDGDELKSGGEDNQSIERESHAEKQNGMNETPQKGKHDNDTTGGEEDAKDVSGVSAVDGVIHSILQLHPYDKVTVDDNKLVWRVCLKDRLRYRPQRKDSSRHHDADDDNRRRDDDKGRSSDRGIHHGRSPQRREDSYDGRTRSRWRHEERTRRDVGVSRERYTSSPTLTTSSPPLPNHRRTRRPSRASSSSSSNFTRSHEGHHHRRYNREFRDSRGRSSSPPRRYADERSRFRIGDRREMNRDFRDGRGQDRYDRESSNAQMERYHEERDRRLNSPHFQQQHHHHQQQRPYPPHHHHSHRHHHLQQQQHESYHFGDDRGRMGDWQAMDSASQYGDHVEHPQSDQIQSAPPRGSPPPMHRGEGIVGGEYASQFHNDVEPTPPLSFPPPLHNSMGPADEQYQQPPPPPPPSTAPPPIIPQRVLDDDQSSVGSAHGRVSRTQSQQSDSYIHKAALNEQLKEPLGAVLKRYYRMKRFGNKEDYKALWKRFFSMVMKQMMDLYEQGTTPSADTIREMVEEEARVYFERVDICTIVSDPDLHDSQFSFDS